MSTFKGRFAPVHPVSCSKTPTPTNCSTRSVAPTGDSLFAASILTRLVEHYVHRPVTAPPQGPDVLTDRETEVLTLVGHGMSNHEIAAALSVSVKTVKTHIGNLLAKLHARDRAHLVIAAYETGLVALG